MVIRILTMGRTRHAYVREGVELYMSRLAHYSRVEFVEIPDQPHKSGLPDQTRQREGESILRHIRPEDHVVLLDENGKSFSSTEWATWIQKQMNAGTRTLVFIVGGAYGFSEEVRKRSNQSVSLSKMTFPHDLVRVIMVEQLYRAFTILKGENYHHE